jgi:hypothetical protein
MCDIFLGDPQYPEQADHVQETGRGSADRRHHRAPAGGQPSSGPHILSQSRGKTSLKPQVLCVIIYLYLHCMIFYKGFFPFTIRYLEEGVFELSCHPVIQNTAVENANLFSAVITSQSFC